MKIYTVPFNNTDNKLTRELRYHYFDSLDDLFEYEPIFQYIDEELKIYIDNNKHLASFANEGQRLYILNEIYQTLIEINEGVVDFEQYIGRYKSSPNKPVSIFIHIVILFLLIEKAEEQLSENEEEFLSRCKEVEEEKGGCYSSACKLWGKFINEVTTVWYSRVNPNNATSYNIYTGPVPVDADKLRRYQQYDWSIATHNFDKDEIIHIANGYKSFQDKVKFIELVTEKCNLWVNVSNDTKERKAFHNYMLSKLEEKREFVRFKEEVKHMKIYLILNSRKDNNTGNVQNYNDSLNKELENKNKQIQELSDQYEDKIKNYEERLSNSMLINFCEIAKKYMNARRKKSQPKRSEVSSALKDIRSLLKLKLPEELENAIDNFDDENSIPQEITYNIEVQAGGTNICHTDVTNNN